MGPTVIFLFSIGLCLNWEVSAQMDTLPRPTLWAVPSPMISKGENATLRCQGKLGTKMFQLWREGLLIDERHATGHLADFVLGDVDDQKDARNYSCRYGQGSLWSELSEPLALVVMTDSFPKSYISVSPGPEIHPGTNVTFTCKLRKQPPSQVYSFALLEAKSLEPLQRQRSRGTTADFPLQSVRARDSGSYSCIYYRDTVPHRGSQPSQALELTVTGLLPKPTLWIKPALLVPAGTNITFWCSRPKLSSLQDITFTLSKAGIQEHLQLQTSEEPWTGFHLPSVRPEDTGSYSCAYKDSRITVRESEPSDVLKLVVPGSLPRPSLSALPGLIVEPGTHVKLQCWQPPQSSVWRVTFILLKQGIPKPLQTQSPAGPSADFHLLSMRAEDAGNYSCVYHGTTMPYQVSELSEALEVLVTASEPRHVILSGSLWTQCNNTLIFTLSCVSFLLLFCILLVAFLCHQSIHMRSLQKDSSRRSLCCPCLLWGTSRTLVPYVPREETLNTEVARERPGEPSVSTFVNPQEVTYSLLNLATVNKKRIPMETHTETTLYASVSED